MDRLLLAKEGPVEQPSLGPDDWTKLSCKQKVEALYRCIKAQGTDDGECAHETKEFKELQSVLSAVVEEEANKEFLRIVRSWEESVRVLEKECGVLFDEKSEKK